MLHLGGKRVDEAERGKSSAPDTDGLGFELDKNQFVNKIQPSSWIIQLDVPLGCKHPRALHPKRAICTHQPPEDIQERADCPPSRGAIRGSVLQGLRERYKQSANRGREERRDGAKLPLFKTVLDAVEKFHTVLMGHKW